METRAPFIVVGAFVLAAIGAVFGFVYWLNNTTGLSRRAVYHVQFDGSVSGLLVGASVLFNGIKVGEITGLGLVPEHPRQVNATIAVAEQTPVRRDTRVGLEFQGLTGVPVIALEGGKETSSAEPVGVLIAEPGAGQSMTQAARDALRRVDSVLSDNAEPLHATIANLQTFSEGLAKNTPRLDGIIAGVERMTGAVPAPRKTIYDLRAVSDFPEGRKELRGQLVIPEPTAVVMLQTQRFLFAPGAERAGFADAQWSDALPSLIRAKLLQSFENFDIAHAPSRDANDADRQLLIDLRTFQLSGAADDATAEIGLSAKLVDKSGRVVAARIFSASKKLDRIEPAAAAAAFGDAFASVERDLVSWTAASL
jgi:phospholipid/cholesterol/gamma-HCH transport system substrate-binding protein